MRKNNLKWLSIGILGLVVFAFAGVDFAFAGQRVIGTLLADRITEGAAYANAAAADQGAASGPRSIKDLEDDATVKEIILADTTGGGTTYTLTTSETVTKRFVVMPGVVINGAGTLTLNSEFDLADGAIGTATLAFGASAVGRYVDSGVLKFVGPAEFAGSMSIGNTAFQPYEVDALSAYGSGTAYTDDTINTALVAIGTVNKTTLLLRPGTWVVNENRDWSSYTNVTFKIASGVSLSHGAYTLNIPNPYAGMYQWLSGTGTISFSGEVASVPSVWFGVDGIQKALNAAKFVSADAELNGQLGCEVLVPAGRFDIATTLSIPPNVNLRGAGKLSTILVAVGLTEGGTVVTFEPGAGGQANSKISDLTISGGALASVTAIDLWDGTGAASQQNFVTLSNLYITRYTTGVRVSSGASGKYIIYSKIDSCRFDPLKANAVSVYADYGVNYLSITENNFFATGASAGTSLAIKTDTNFFGDFFEISNNSIDHGNASAVAFSFASDGSNSSVHANIHDNRIESGAITTLTGFYAHIHHNWINSVPKCLNIGGVNNIIEQNHLYVSSADQQSNYDTAIIVNGPADDTRIGENYYGIYGTDTYTPVRYSDGGTGTVAEPKRWASTGATGIHEKGDIAQTLNPSIGARVLKYCTTAGTVSTATATTGTVDAGDLYHMVVADATGYNRGDYIDVVGLSARMKIKWISQATNTIRFTSAASGAVAGAAVTIGAPVYSLVGSIVKKDTTANRPTPSATEIGVFFMDTTLDADGLPIWWNGTKWIKADGSDA